MQITNGILLCADHCLDDTNDPEDELLKGIAGYMYVVNLIYNDLSKTLEGISKILDEVVESNTDFFDLRMKTDGVMLSLSSTIKQLAMTLAKQT